MTVLNLPRTHEGSLARKISQAERDLRVICKTKVKVVERVGVTLKAQLVKANQWSNMNCNRSNCLPCFSGESKKFSCCRRSATYLTQCKLCQANDLKVVYIGETSNSIYERALQHMKSTSEDKEGHMTHHLKECHPGAAPIDSFSIREITPTHLHMPDNWKKLN